MLSYIRKDSDTVNIQLKKGVLELCVLAILSDKDYYGYELVNEMSKNISLSEGTIYPLLRRLKAEKFVTTYLQESSEGPPRKYYKLTKAGQKAKDKLLSEWNSIVTGVNNIVKGRNEHD